MFDDNLMKGMEGSKTFKKAKALTIDFLTGSNLGDKMAEKKEKNRALTTSTAFKETGIQPPGGGVGGDVWSNLSSGLKTLANTNPTLQAVGTFNQWLDTKPSDEGGPGIKDLLLKLASRQGGFGVPIEWKK